MGLVVALLPAQHTVELGQLGLDGFLEFGKGGVLACAEGAQRGQRHVGDFEQRFGVFELGRGAELVDAVGKDRNHLLPALAFGCRNPGVFKAAFVNAQHGQKLLEHLKAAAGVKVACGVVAVARVAAGNQHAVRAVEQRLDDEQRVNAARTGHTDDAQVCGLGGAGHTGRIRTAIRTPVAEKTYNSKFFAVQHWHKAFTSARIWLSVACESWMAPCGQVDVHRPQP